MSVLALSALKMNHVNLQQLEFIQTSGEGCTKDSIVGEKCHFRVVNHSCVCVRRRIIPKRFGKTNRICGTLGKSRNDRRRPTLVTFKELRYVPEHYHYTLNPVLSTRLQSA